MRVMVRTILNTERSNALLRSGELPRLVGGFVERFRPEAAYFALCGGRRCAYFILDLKDTAAMPALVEDFLLDFEAEVEVIPVMNADDLRTGWAALKVGAARPA